MFEEILDEYRRRGYSLAKRTTPQPHQQDSWEQRITRILWNTGSVTVPLKDPIYFALMLIFQLSEEGVIYTLNTIPILCQQILFPLELNKVLRLYRKINK